MRFELEFEIRDKKGPKTLQSLAMMLVRGTFKEIAAALC